MTKLELKNPEELDGLDSTYDFKLHMPIPSLDFIRQETGEDLIILSGTESKAKAHVKNLTKLAMSYVLADKIRNTRYKLEYLIAKNAEYRYAFLNFVAQIVFEVINSSALETYLSNAKDLDNMFTNWTKTTLKGSILNVDYFRQPLKTEEIRVGY